MCAFIRCSLPLIAWLLLVSCGGQPTETPTPVVKATVTPIPTVGIVFPTPVPIPEPPPPTPPVVATVGVPTPAISAPKPAPVNRVTPSAAPAASLTLDEYAEACALLMERPPNIVDGLEFDQWAREFQKLRPPVNLVDYHNYTFDLYRDVDENGGRIVSRMPYIRVLQTVMQLDDTEGSTLEGSGCLSFHLAFLVASSVRDARARLHRRLDTGEAMSLDDYARACADIALASPWGESIEALASHWNDQWERLAPPEWMREYHDATQSFYEEWFKAGHLDPAGEKRMKVITAAVRLPDSTREALASYGCTGT